MPLPLILALVLAASGSQAQSPTTSTVTPPAGDAASAPLSTPVYQSDLDFSYSYTPDWTVVDTKPMMPAVQLQAQEKASDDTEKQAANCLQIGLLLRRGKPASLIMAIGISYACLGKSFQSSDLPGFGTGVAIGMARSFDVTDPQYGAYKLGSHNLWIERAKAKSKNDPSGEFTMETVCALLKKGAVCWMGMAHDNPSLTAFERGQVVLETDAPAALVPEGNIFKAQ